MRKKLFAPAAVLILALSLLCSCEIDEDASIKSLTKPYINEYVCTYAYLGDVDILEDMEYIKVTFTDEETLEVSFRKNGGKKHAFECAYARDEETGEFIIDFGVFGADDKPKILIKDGKFNVTKQLGKKLLVMVFEVK